MSAALPLFGASPDVLGSPRQDVQGQSGQRGQGDEARQGGGAVEPRLNIGSMCTGARIMAVKNDLAKVQLTSPVCTKVQEKVALSRRVDKHWRLIGWGTIQAGQSLEVSTSK